MKTTRRVTTVPVILTMAVLLAFAACDRGGNKTRYAAEKSLFRARKMREELGATSLKPEFLDKALESYRLIVRNYRDRIDNIEGMEEIIVSAQMELAELEFLSGMLEIARDDFKEAYRLARTIRAARVNALYSAAVISQELGDMPGAIARFRQFQDEFLGQDALLETAALNTRYLVTPLKIAELYQASDNGKEADRWNGTAVQMFNSVIENTDNELLAKEMRFNVLTAYLQGKRWREALETIGKLKNIYADSEADLPPLLFIEAKIQHEGFSNTTRAIELYRRVYREYPESGEALTALLVVGGIRFEDKRYNEAEKIYRQAIDTYGEGNTETVEASWQLARIAEIRGKWLDASLMYKSIYTNFPGTIEGFEAPLRIANHFRDRGEKDAAEAACNTAVEQYEKIISSQAGEGVRIMAEEYIVRAFSEQDKWHDAIRLLLLLPDKYPRYTRFRENYLAAASIYENELGDGDAAAETLSKCMERYRGSNLAAEAERQYRRIKGPE